MSSSRVITFRDPSVGPVLDPSKAKDLALLSVALTATTSGPGLTLSVQGIAKGIAGVNVAARSAGAALSAAAVLDAATGLFTATFAGYPLSADAALSIEASDAAGPAKDRGAIAAPALVTAAFPAAETASPGKSRRFLAGNTDRLVRSRSYCPLIYEPLEPFGCHHLALGELRKGQRAKALEPGGLLVSAGDLARQAKAQIAALRREATDGRLTPAEFQEARCAAYVDAAMALGERWGTGRDAPAIPLAAATLRAGAPGLQLLRKGVGPERKAIALWAPATLGGDRQIRAAWQQLLTALLRRRLAPPLGVLFDDRLRFQPAGLVVGEEVSTLSLAPGEEVQVRQTVETKRRTALEEVTDRETERQVTLSSSWSTDITAALQESDSSEHGSRVGGDFGSDLASVGIPVHVGGSATFNADSAHATTSNTSRAEHVEAAASATARMRAQHKVRLEVTTEDSSSLSATRTVRNPNPLRGCTYIFYKLYRRERVSLERYGARLCLALEVEDPARDTRAAFLDGLAKLDPDNPANFRSEVPKVVTARWPVRLDGSDAVEGVAESHDSDTEDPYATTRYTIGPLKLKGRSRVDDTLSVDSTFILLETPTVAVVSFRGEDGERRYGQGAFEGYEHGNSVKLLAPLPQIHAQDPEIAIRSVLTEAYDVQAEIVSRWGPDDATALAYAAARAAERETLLSGLRLERLLELRDVAVSQYEGVVLSRAVERHLRAAPALTELAEIFDVKDLFVRSTPQWATARGRRIYRELRARVERLPILIDAEDLLPEALTASQATVFLPVREGREADALALLKQFPAARARDAVRDLEAFRDRSFPAAASPVVTGADVLSPLPVTGTPLGAAAWANAWEEPTREFLVLAQWSETVPTDGLHLEMLLSGAPGADEVRLSTLSRLDQA